MFEHRFFANFAAAPLSAFYSVGRQILDARADTTLPLRTGFGRSVGPGQARPSRWNSTPEYRMRNRRSSPQELARMG